MKTRTYKKISSAQLKKINRIKEMIFTAQGKLYDLEIENADNAAFELDAVINMLDSADTWIA